MSILRYKRRSVCFMTVLSLVIASVFGCFSAYAYEVEEAVISMNNTASVNISNYIYGERAVPAFFSNPNLTDTGESFNFGDQLDPNNKAVYDALSSKWLTPTNEKIVVPLPEFISYQTKEPGDISSWSQSEQDNFWNVVTGATKNSRMAFILDFPEVLWLDMANIDIAINYNISFNYRKGIYTIIVNKLSLTAAVSGSFRDMNEAAYYQQYLADRINEFRLPEGDRYTKLRYLHNYIANNVRYDIQSPYRDSALGLFIEPYTTVCEGYSEAFKLVCDREGIPCVSVLGNMNVAARTAHMWNYVMMENGRWYAVDCTWDDLDDENRPFKYDYFLVGSNKFFEKHYEDKSYMVDGLKYPELSITDYNYKPSSTTTTAPGPGTTTTTTTTVTTMTTPPVIPVPGILKGDFNHDGFISVADVVVLQQKLLGKYLIEDEDFLYDMNADGKINVWDYVLLIRKLM